MYLLLVSIVNLFLCYKICKDVFYFKGPTLTPPGPIPMKLLSTRFIIFFAESRAESSDAPTTPPKTFFGYF